MPQESMFADNNSYESSVRTAPDKFPSAVRQIPKSQGRRLLSLAFGGGVAGFISWCILDLVTVRVLPYPDRVGDFDWVLGLVPIVFLGYAFWYFRSAESGNRAWLAFGSLLLAMILTAGLLLFFGLGFHFAIGGKL